MAEPQDHNIGAGQTGGSVRLRTLVLAVAAISVTFGIVAPAFYLGLSR